MGRTASTTRSAGDQITSARLQAFNTEIDSLYSGGSDRGRVIMAVSGTALRVDILPFTWIVGSYAGQYAGITNYTVTNSATNYIEINSSGTIVTNTSAWVDENAKLAKVICAGGVVTSIESFRSDIVGGVAPGSAIITNRAYPADTVVLKQSGLYKFISIQKMIMAGLSKYLSFGDGSDGDVTIAGTVTLTRDMYYNNLTIPAATVLIPDGYRIFVMGTISGTGTVRRNGNNGAAGQAYNAGSGGGAAGATLNQGSLNAEVAAGAGAAGTTTYYAATGGSGTSVNPSMSSINGVAGGSAQGWSGNASGGSAGTTTRGADYLKIFDYTMMHLAMANGGVSAMAYKGGASSGGGSGGGGNNQAAGGGGGAGSNGGFIRIAAYHWNFTGVIESKGGNGGAGGNGNAGSNQFAGGGGGGGCGGTIFRIVSIIENDCTTVLTGGTGGAAGTGYGTAGAGVAGNTGQFISITT